MKKTHSKRMAVAAMVFGAFLLAGGCDAAEEPMNQDRGGGMADEKAMFELMRYDWLHALARHEGCQAEAEFVKSDYAAWSAQLIACSDRLVERVNFFPQQLCGANVLLKRAEFIDYYAAIKSLDDNDGDKLRNGDEFEAGLNPCSPTTFGDYPDELLDLDGMVSSDSMIRRRSAPFRASTRPILERDVSHRPSERNDRAFRMACH